MHIPGQPLYFDFISSFLHLLFGADDRICLCSNVAGEWKNHFYSRSDAVTWLHENPCTPNLYFRASAFGSGPSFTQANCTRVNALFLDIDYGSEGHMSKNPFNTLDDVTGYLLTMPLKPSLAWHTGHGVQCAYLLDQTLVFQPGGGAADALKRYTGLGSKLKTMAMADATFTAEHAYRVPMTVNSKSHSHTGLADITGSLLWYEDNRRYRIEDIEAVCAGYDIKDLIQAEAEPVDASDESRDAGADYQSLPADLRAEIEDTGSERSTRLFAIIGEMIRSGYGNEFIIEAVGHGSDFVDKYRHRDGGLRHEVLTCAAKIRKGRYVYGGGSVPTLRVYNTPVSVALRTCDPLSADMQAMLSRYGETVGKELRASVRDAARFHEHIASANPCCVLESPCGAGKSVWAHCHIAVHATAEDRYIYVTETVDALYEAAEVLDRLARVPVGRVHGFNACQCSRLSNHNYTWDQCARNDSRSRCIECGSRDTCAYHTRQRQERCAVLCMTHAGFINALEDGSAMLEDAHVIVDEGLSPFGTWSVTHDDLQRVASLYNLPCNALASMFPYTSAAASELSRFQLEAGSDIYARRNYVYRNEAETAALAGLIDDLRTALRRGPELAAFAPARQPLDHQHCKEVLAGLLNFFRPSAGNDAAYAYHESSNESGCSIICKRSRFNFGTGGTWQSLHMMNASASLSPFPYPDSMPVFTCPDVPDNSGHVTLHCIKANPTKSNKDEAVRVGAVPLALNQRMRLHRQVLVCLNKDMHAQETIENNVRQICGEDTKVTVLTRGRIKGVNSAGDCTLALLQGMSLFTGIDDCALHAALQYRRSFPDTPYVYTVDGSPNWPGGRMLVPAMRSYYALRSLDEVYQAIWRTAVRNDKPVEAVIVIPDSHWLAALYRTVMPNAVIGSAYASIDSTVLLPGGTSATYDFEMDDRLYGMGVCAMAPGAEIAKADVALALGYNGDASKTTKKPKTAWVKNKDAIMALVGDLFEEATARNLRRCERS